MRISRLKIPSVQWGANPLRVVRLHGSFSQTAARALVKKIQKFQLDSSEPITVYINSMGGEARAFYKLERIFRKMDEAGNNNKLITVAGNAASAAACLLVAGHQAYVGRIGKLDFHGVGARTINRERTLRREQVLSLALNMNRENRRVARKMAQRVAYRLMNRITQIADDISENSRRVSSHLIVRELARRLRRRLATPSAKQLLVASLSQFNLVFAMVEYFPKTTPLRRSTNLAMSEAELFKAVINHEFNGRPGMKKLNPSLALEMAMNYIFVREFFLGKHQVFVDQLMQDRAKVFLSNAQAVKYQHWQQKSAGRASDYLKSQSGALALGVWCLAYTICMQLLSGQNTIMATDAYWLGLIDGVIEKLPS